ncbi:MAG: DNA-processing protein DprA, partial [Rickettsiales bacterium]|nr:DNA-processing protein DprA [Rickettsiales bacterium]
MPENKVDFIRLLRAEGVGTVTFYRLLVKFGGAARALEFLERERGQKVFSKSRAEDEIAAAEKKGVRMLFSFDDDYPYLLKQIPDRPPLLYVLGDARTLSRRALAVVGARNASMNGKGFASVLARQAVDAGYAVVSGLAIGIDTAAHVGALSSQNLAGTKTVAVLAGGVDNIYPPSNRGLYAKVMEEGAVISEQPLGTEPMANFFPRRNRIVSGLSLGTAIVEASLKSGSLITARYAAAQSREVFAVPNFPLDPRANGTNDLIRNGATLVENVGDITSVLDGIKVDPDGSIFSVNEDDYYYADYEDVDGRALEERILSLLSAAPTGVDALLRELSGHTHSQVASALLNLELDDKI